MTNNDQDQSSINSNAISEQRPSFLEKILNDKSYNHKELEGFRTKILQDRSDERNGRELGGGWSRDWLSRWVRYY